MCGIAGVYRRGGAGEDLQVVQAMLRALQSRGPDGEGSVREGPLCLGHRRLAILDLSEAARQPMASPSGRFLISFNGEIYNFRELIREMGIDPHSLRTSSDTEILLLAWERWGSSCLERLVGQWAFALYDREERRLWLVRDRFGEKPIYYHRCPEALTFASTIRSLLKAPWIPREIDADRLAEYLTLRYVVSPGTVLREVMKIPPGHLLTLRPPEEEVRCWWSPRFRRAPREAPALRREEATEEFGELLQAATRRCLISDVPVALLLSNGIDSNSIKGVLDAGSTPVPCFTYKAVDRGQESGTNGKGRNEISFSYEEIARSLAPALASLNEPVGDGSALATWILIRAARPQATVFLCGHGADEILGGYRLSQDRFRLSLLRRFCRFPLPLMDDAVRHFANGEGPAPVRRAALGAAAAALAPAAAQYLIHRPLPFGDLSDLLGDRPAPGSYLRSIQRLYSECGAEATDLDRMQEVLLRTFLSENILSCCDSVAMDSSAELRMPFLDRDLVNFVLGLRPEMRVSRWPGRANTKLILRWWGRNRLPAELLKRPKRAFRFGSIRTLLRQEGNEIRNAILDSKALRRHLPGLAAWMREPEALPRGTWGGTTWALAGLAVWCENADVG